MSQSRKILRSPTMMRRKTKPVPVNEKVQLEKVLGLTVQNNAALQVDPNTGTVAYPAGCVVVLYNPKKNRQRHIFNHGRKTITCLAFSADGKHLVTGESGHQPAVRVWDVEETTQISEFHGHKFGINCVAFHPNLKYVVSIGTQHDMAVNVWNWKANVKVASNKLATKVTGIAFSEDGSMFVTSGNRHVKFWYLDTKSKVIETVPLMGRSGILGDQRNNCFSGIVMGKGRNSHKAYSITQSGLLCEFNEKRLLDKWVELRTTKAQCICASDDKLFIGCADGIIRVFSPDTLHYMLTLPKPHYLGVDVAAGKDPSHMLNSNGNKHPDTIAVALDRKNHKVAAVYNDHSLYVWDVRDIKKIGKMRSSLYHSGMIWGIDMYPDVDEDAPLPPGSFITCSGDDTVRIWNIDTGQTTRHRNIYSDELLKVVYADPDLTTIMDNVYNPAGTTDKTDNQNLEKNGVRAIKINPTGRQLATGDRAGNIKIYDTENWSEVISLAAHDSEVLCLEYTEVEAGINLLASSSRDRLIHVFDADQQYGLIQTLDDHSAAITAVRFMEKEGSLHMISCGADKSLLFRSAQQDPDFQFVLNRHLVGKTTLYDMVIDSTKKFVATACQDRNVRIYNITNGKQKKSYKGATGDDGYLIKVQLDPSGAYVASSCSDKNLAIFDFFTGECAATMFGHSELVTGVKFTNDLRRVISVSGDGCIFVWRLPSELTEHMQNRMLDIGKIPQDLVSNPDTGSLSEDGQFVPAKILAQDNANGNILEQTMTEKPGYRFSVGQLPQWAKKQAGQDGDPKTATKEQKRPLSGSNVPRGRWAARVESVHPIMSVLEKSSFLNDSIDGVNLANQLRRETVPRNDPMKTSLVIQQIDDDETNKDDEEDDEFTNNRDNLEDHFDSDALSQDFGNGVTTRMSGKQGSPPVNFRKMFDRIQSMDKDEEEDDSGHLIYLPSEQGSETSETSSFQVHEGETTSAKDTESEGTDPLDSEDESTPPTPTTPLDLESDFSEAAARDKFLHMNFENLDSTFKINPDGIQALDQTMILSESSLPHPRLSISTRFLSRAQQQQLRELQMDQRSQSPSLRANEPLPGEQGRSRISAVPEKGKPIEEPKGRSRPLKKKLSLPCKLQLPRVKVRRQNTEDESPSSGRDSTPTRSRQGRARSSYQQATESSLAKNKSMSTNSLNKTDPGTTLKDPKTTTASKDTTRRSRLKGGKLSSEFKSKFKSTPDLLSAEQDEEESNEPVFLPPKVTDDAHLTVSTLNRYEMKTRAAARRSMPATKLRDPFAGMSTEHIADRSARKSLEDPDRMIMPPPTLSSNKQDLYSNQTKQVKKPGKSDLTLDQAKAILMRKPNPSAPSANTETDLTPERGTSVPVSTSAGYKSALNTQFPPGKSGYSYLMNNNHLKDLDASPNEPPVKDTSSRQKPEPRASSPSKILSGGRLSPFVGQQRDVFDFGSTSPSRTNRRLPDVPKSDPSSPESSPAEGSPTRGRGNYRLDHTFVIEKPFEEDDPAGSVQDRISLFEMKSPKMSRSDGASRWRRERYSLGGEGDDAGLSEPGSPTRGPRHSSVSHSVSAESLSSTSSSSSSNPPTSQPLPARSFGVPTIPATTSSIITSVSSISISSIKTTSKLTTTTTSTTGATTTTTAATTTPVSVTAVSSDSWSNRVDQPKPPPRRRGTTDPNIKRDPTPKVSSRLSLVDEQDESGDSPEKKRALLNQTSPGRKTIQFADEREDSPLGRSLSPSSLQSSPESLRNSSLQSPPSQLQKSPPNLQKISSLHLKTVTPPRPNAPPPPSITPPNLKNLLQPKTSVQQPPKTSVQQPPKTSVQQPPPLPRTSEQQPRGVNISPSSAAAKQPSKLPQEVVVDPSMDDEDEEIKRPDKSVTSPPTSLLMTSPLNTSSKVTLNPPSSTTSLITPSSITGPISSTKSGSPQPDRSKLNLTLTNSTSQRVSSEDECVTAVKNLEAAVDKVIAEFSKLTGHQTKITEKAILTAGLEDAYKKMCKFVPPPETAAAAAAASSSSSSQSNPHLDEETANKLKQYTDSMMDQVVELLWKRFDSQGAHMA